MRAKQPVSIAGIEFNALLEQVTNYENTIPEFPTEKGFTVEDAIINKPIRLELVVYLVDTPVSWIEKFGKIPNRTQKVLEELEKLYVKKTPVTVVTTQKVYKNMGIESMKIPSKVETGYAYEIPITLKEIKVTETKTIVAPSFPRGSTSRKNQGNASAKNGKGKGSKQNKKGESILHNLGSNLKGLGR